MFGRFIIDIEFDKEIFIMKIDIINIVISVEKIFHIQ